MLSGGVTVLVAQLVGSLHESHAYIRSKQNNICSIYTFNTVFKLLFSLYLKVFFQYYGYAIEISQDSIFREFLHGLSVMFTFSRQSI